LKTSPTDKKFTLIQDTRAQKFNPYPANVEYRVSS